MKIAKEKVYIFRELPSDNVVILRNFVTSMITELPWKPLLYMETVAVYGNRCCLWRPLLSMETVAVYGDRCCLWKPLVLNPLMSCCLHCQHEVLQIVPITLAKSFPQAGLARVQFAVYSVNCTRNAKCTYYRKQRLIQ